MKTFGRILGIFIIIAVMLLCVRCAFSQTSGNTPPPPPVCGSTNAGALYTNTGTSPATVYTCSYYNLAWQWVVNPSYGGLVSYPTVPTTCSGVLPVFLAGWPNTQEYVCVNGVPDAIGGAGSGVTTFAAPSASWPTWLVPTVINPTTTPSLAVAAGIVPPANGGTGATTAAGAWTNIFSGAAIVTNCAVLSTGSDGALTCSPTSYLPLSGGTLTGALNGTSASFSGTVAAGATVAKVANGIQKADQFTGTTASEKMVACLAAAGNGTCDATGLLGVQTMDSTVEVGLGGLTQKLITAPGTTWEPTGASTPTTMFQIDHNGSLSGGTHVVLPSGFNYTGNVVAVTDTISGGTPPVALFGLSDLFCDGGAEAAPTGYCLYMHPPSGGYLQLLDIYNVRSTFMNGLYMGVTGTDAYINGVNFHGIALEDNNNPAKLLVMDSGTGTLGVNNNNFYGFQLEGVYGPGITYIGSSEINSNFFFGSIYDMTTPISNAASTATANVFTGFIGNSITDPTIGTATANIYNLNANSPASQSPRGFFSLNTGPLTAIPTYTNLGSFKMKRNGTIENIVGSAGTFTCSVNPTIILLDCGTTVSTCGSGTNSGGVAITGANFFDGYINAPTLLAGHYYLFEPTAGTCTAASLSVSVEYLMQ